MREQMKLPEPVGVIAGKIGNHCSFRSNVVRKGESVYSANQLRAEIERRDAVLREVLDQLVNLQPILANGLLTEQQLQFIDPHIDEAMRVIQEALG